MREWNENRRVFPRRIHFGFALVAFMVVAVYGSLTPFGYRPTTVSEAIERVRPQLTMAWGMDSKADWAANVLLFVPIGFLALGVVGVDRRRLVGWLLAVPVVATCGALSACIEFAQVWFPARVVSRNDVLAETLGAALGAAAWIAVGQWAANWIRRPAASMRSARWMDWVLWLYLVCLADDLLAPMDFTISLTDLYHKYQSGHVMLVPFAGWTQGNLDLVRAAAWDVIQFVPVGVLGAIGLTGRDRPVRSWGKGTALGLLAVVGFETAQLFLVGRFADTTDVLTGILGVAMGSWLAGRLFEGSLLLGKDGSSRVVANASPDDAAERSRMAKAG